MSNERILSLLKIERECVLRASRNECSRDCANCNLVQDDKELLEMYSEVIEFYEGRVKFELREQEITFNRINGCS